MRNIARTKNEDFRLTAVCDAFRPTGISPAHALKGAMISVFIECKDQEKALAVTLAALVHGAVEGLVAEVVILDQGSRDGTALLAGCGWVAGFLQIPICARWFRSGGAPTGCCWFGARRPGRCWAGPDPISAKHIARGQAGRTARFRAVAGSTGLPFMRPVARPPSRALRDTACFCPSQGHCHLRGSPNRWKASSRGLGHDRLKCEIVPAASCLRCAEAGWCCIRHFRDCRVAS